MENQSTSQEISESTPLPPSQEQYSWCIHSSIDPVLASDKSRKAKSNDPGWKYAWWPNVTNKDLVQCFLCGHKNKGGIKRLKQHLIGGFRDVVNPLHYESWD